MATIARTADMFLVKAETETSTRNGWDAVVQFVSWMLTPRFAMDYAEELAAKHQPHTWMHSLETWG